MLTESYFGLMYCVLGVCQDMLLLYMSLWITDLEPWLICCLYFNKKKPLGYHDGFWVVLHLVS